MAPGDLWDFDREKEFNIIIKERDRNKRVAKYWSYAAVLEFILIMIILMV